MGTEEYHVTINNLDHIHYRCAVSFATYEMIVDRRRCDYSGVLNFKFYAAALPPPLENWPEGLIRYAEALAIDAESLAAADLGSRRTPLLAMGESAGVKCGYIMPSGRSKIVVHQYSPHWHFDAAPPAWWSTVLVTRVRPRPLTALVWEFNALWSYSRMPPRQNFINRGCTAPTCGSWRDLVLSPRKLHTNSPQARVPSTRVTSRIPFSPTASRPGPLNCGSN